MGAHGAEDLIVSFCDGENLIEAAHARRDGDYEAHAGAPSTCEDAVEVTLEFGKIEMAVAIDQHQVCALASLST